MRLRWCSAALAISTLACDSFSSETPGPDASLDAAGDAANSAGDAGDAGSAGDAGQTGEPQIVVGGRHTCALKRNGELWCWGDASLIGAERVGSPFNPTRVVLPGTPEPQAVQIAAGSEHTCAVSKNEHLYCWGSNAAAQLTGAAPSAAPKPFDVPLPDGAVGFLSVVAGPNHTCVVARTADASNAAYCWGANSGMQVGKATGGAPVDVPNRIANLSGKVLGVAAGEFVSCAWTSTSAGYCWGSGADGRRGDGTTAAQENAVAKAIVSANGATPLQGIDRIWVGKATGCARVIDGVSCWGELGRQKDGNDAGFPLPLVGTLVRQVTISQSKRAAGYLSDDGAPWYWGDSFAAAPSTAPTLAPARMVLPAGLDASARVSAWAIGDRHQCIAVQHANPALPTFFCAGANEADQLGNSLAAPTGTSTFVPVFNLFDR